MDVGPPRITLRARRRIRAACALLVLRRFLRSADVLAAGRRPTTGRPRRSTRTPATRLFAGWRGRGGSRKGDAYGRVLRCGVSGPGHVDVPKGDARSASSRGKLPKPLSKAGFSGNQPNPCRRDFSHAAVSSGPQDREQTGSGNPQLGRAYRDDAEWPIQGAPPRATRPSRPTAPGATSREPGNRRPAPCPPPPRRPCSWSRNTMRPGCTTISGSSTAACSGAGRCREVHPWTRTTSAWPCMSRTTRWITPASRAPSPPGQYGAGTVEIWDRGTWARVGGDPAADLARGEMKFTLAGSRLQGRFVLVRLKPRPQEHAENWLLIKEHDEHESAGLGPPWRNSRSVRLAPQPPTRRKAPPPRSRTRRRRAPPAAACPAAQAPQLAAVAGRAAHVRRVDQRDQVRRLPPARSSRMAEPSG